MKTSFKEFKFNNKSLLALLIFSTIVLLIMITLSVICDTIELNAFHVWLLSLYINAVFHMYCNNTIEYMKDIFYLDSETEKMNKMTELRMYYKKRKQIRISLIFILIAMLSFSIYDITYAFTHNKILIPIVYYAVSCISNKTVLTKWVKFIKVLFKCAQIVDGKENELYLSPNKNSNEVNDNEEKI